MTLAHRMRISAKLFPVNFKFVHESEFANTQWWIPTLKQNLQAEKDYLSFDALTVYHPSVLSAMVDVVEQHVQ